MILLLQHLDLLVCLRLFQRLLRLHDLHQRGLVRHAAVRGIVFVRDVHSVRVLEEVAGAQERVRERLVRRVEQRRQCARLRVRRRRRGRFVRVVLRLQLQELALQRWQGDRERARRRRSARHTAWEERVVVRYIGVGRC